MQLDGEGRAVGLPVAEHELERPCEPVAAHGIVRVLLGHERNAPAGQALEHGTELLASRCEPEERGGNRWRGVLAFDHARSLELAEPVGEQVGCDAGQPVAEVCVATGAAQRELANDQERPAVAYDVEGFRHCAVLVVGPHG